MRIEIPEKLMGDFKCLEQYGHAMKTKHKAGFKRHIKMDDADTCLYMDAFIPKVKDWVRIDLDVARADNEKRMKKKATSVRIDLLCTVDSEEEK